MKKNKKMLMSSFAIPLLAMSVSLLGGCGSQGGGGSQGGSTSTSTPISIPSVSPEEVGYITFNEGYALDKIYDRVAIVAPTSANYQTNSEGAVTVSWYSGDNLLSAAPNLAGDYKVKLTVAETAKFPSLEATKTFTISKKALSINLEEYYQGSAYFYLSPTGVITLDKTFATIQLSSSAVGTYTGDDIISITLSGIDEENYSLAKSDVHLTIVKDKFINDDTAWISKETYQPDKTYDGDPAVAPTIADLVMDGVEDPSFVTIDSITWFEDDPSELIPLDEAPTDAGEYWVYMNFAASATQEAGSVYRSVIIEPKTLTKTAFTKAFDNSKETNIVLTEEDGIVTSDVSKNVTAYFLTSSQNVSTYQFSELESNGIFIGSDVCDNYQFDEANTTFAITQKTDLGSVVAVSSRVSKYYVAYPTLENAVVASNVPSYVTTYYSYVTKVFGSNLYVVLSNDPDNPVTLPTGTSKITGDYDLHVRIPGTGNYAGVTINKASGFTFYADSSFVDVTSGVTQNIYNRTTYYFKADADGNLSNCEFSVSSATGAYRIIDSDGKQISLTKTFTIDADGTFYCIFEATSTHTSCTITFIQS